MGWMRHTVNGQTYSGVLFMQRSMNTSLATWTAMAGMAIAATAQANAGMASADPEGIKAKQVFILRKVWFSIGEP